MQVINEVVAADPSRMQAMLKGHLNIETVAPNADPDSPFLAMRIHAKGDQS